MEQLNDINWDKLVALKFLKIRWYNLDRTDNFRNWDKQTSVKYFTVHSQLISCEISLQIKIYWNRRSLEPFLINFVQA